MCKGLNRLLELRLDERDRILELRFQEAKDKMNARGMLLSSITADNLYSLIVEELAQSVSVIIDSTIDLYRRRKKLVKRDEAKDKALESLSIRKSDLALLYLKHIDTIRQNLKTKIRSPDGSFEKVYELQKEELSSRLSFAITQYEATFGSNLTKRYINIIFDKPIAALVGVLFMFFGSLGGIVRIIDFFIKNPK